MPADQSSAVVSEKYDGVSDAGEVKELSVNADKCTRPQFMLHPLKFLWYNNEENLDDACVRRDLTSIPIETTVEMV